jgi:hypothetical protein
LNPDRDLHLTLERKNLAPATIHVLAGVNPHLRSTFHKNTAMQSRGRFIASASY